MSIKDLIPAEFQKGGLVDAMRASLKVDGPIWKCNGCGEAFETSDLLVAHEKAHQEPAGERVVDMATGELVDPVESPERPGIYQISNEAYHGGPGGSRSMLWTLFDETPFHARYGERKETDAQRFGTAIHTAVLEPNLFDTKYFRGPDARANSNDWKAAEKIADQMGRTILKPLEYNNALRVRDAAHRNRTIQAMTAGEPAIEQSAYYVDEATGELLKVRPDLYSYGLRVMADLKSTACAAAYEFQKSIATYGYHLQRFMYPLGWEEAGGGAVDAFVFICVEPKPPFALKIYDLEGDAVDEARDVYRIAVDNYHKCMQAERLEIRTNEARKAQGKKAYDDDQLARRIAATCWPGYNPKVEKIDLPAYGYKVRPRG